MKHSDGHIQRADIHVRRMFDYLLNQPNTLYQYLECEVPDLDKELAQSTFEEIAFKAVFENSEASVEDLADPTVASNIWSDTLRTWPETYYMELYVKSGIAYKFQDGDDVIYGLKEAHGDELRRLLTAKSIK